MKEAFVIARGFADRLTRRFGTHIVDWVQAAPEHGAMLLERLPGGITGQ